LNKYPKLRSVLQFGLKNFNNVAVEWVPGAAPTAYFYDGTGSQTSEVVLGDRTLTEVLSIFKDNAFTPTVETQPYPETPLATREYGGHTYIFFNTENPLNYALDKAKSLGGYIVTVTSGQEQDFLGKVLTELQMNRAWLGATDESEEGEWKWTDGPEKDVVFYSHNPDRGVTGYSFWFKGEPNNVDGENCANVFPDGWNDVCCITEKNGLIVEIGQEPLAEPTLPPPPEEPSTPKPEEKSDL